jgi:CDP-glycerol glycerophosphotransferase
MPKLARIPGLRRLPRLIPRPLEQDVVLFESWGGRYSDNPRAISEELGRQKVPLRRVWVGGAKDQGFPSDVIVVEPGSWHYLDYLHRARYIVVNNTLPRYFRKNPESTYLQTWHGTPLKRIAFDVANPTFADSRQYLKGLSSEVASWDFLVSPSRFATDILRRAFRYEGEMIETGYPRNDLLHSPEAPIVRDRVRMNLGISKNERVVLYAPTWRDSPSSFSLRLDLNAVTDEITDVVVLFRAHHLDASSVSNPNHKRVLDVSSYSDIRDLYLAADVLITDYSSVMFDFAVTGKPILFFTYDLEHYRDTLRGFYFDFEKQAPGPLLTSTEAIIDALGDLEDVSNRYRAAYQSFRNTFCHLDDGMASQRVIDTLLGK